MATEELILSEKQYKDDIESQMDFLSQRQLLGSIDIQTIKNWISQFPVESLTPYFLLDSLVFLSTSQIKASLSNIVEQIKSSIYVKNPNLSDEQLFCKYEEHLEQSVFICACLPSQMASGAPPTTRAFRDIIGAKFKSADVADLCKTILERKIENVYIIDDFIGTGATIKKQINYQHACNGCIYNHPKKTCSLACAASTLKNIKFNIISVVLHEQGIINLKKDFPLFNTMAAYYIDDTYNLLSNNCTLYRDDHYKKKIISETKEIARCKNMHQNKYALNLPLAISEAFPNNSLELFWWAQSEDWMPLLARRH